MACPICKSDKFYVKDPSDPFETFEFKCLEGQIEFADTDIEAQAPPVSGDQEIYCQHCAWHGKVRSIAEH